MSAAVERDEVTAVSSVHVVGTKSEKSVSNRPAEPKTGVSDIKATQLSVKKIFLGF